MNQNIISNNKTDEINNNTCSENYVDIKEFIEQEYNKENNFNLNLFNKEGKESSSNNKNLNFYSHSFVRNEFSEFKEIKLNKNMIK